MFEFLFNYSPAVFSKGKFVLLGSWPVWVLVLLILAAAAGVGWNIWRRRGTLAVGMKRWRPALVWLLQAALLALLLVLLWEPALQISTLKPQQNIVAVIVDDSRSMAIAEDGESRSQRAVEVLRGGLLDDLGENFQVRMYRMGAQLERMKSLDQVTAGNQATQIGESLKQVVVEAGSLPIGAVLLLSDGADNSGGIDLETIGEIRSRRIPIHTIGFGREQFASDIEITDVQTPARALADSRLMARVTLKQSGYVGETARLTLRDGGRVLASKEVTFTDSSGQQTEALLFNAGIAGAKHLSVSLDPQQGEENPNNNRVSRLVNVEGTKPRVLYIEGEPRWEYKFIRRALDGDRNVELVSILRTTQNKIYRQGISSAEELEEGFPGEVEELFDYRGLIVGNVDAAYLTSSQQDLIRQFVDRRGGGVLFLGGRSALADGGYGSSTLADLLPVTLPASKGTFHRDRALVKLTAAGRDSLLTRLEEDPETNVSRWEELPQLADYQDAGLPKPGALVLAELESPTGRT
ncbi:MAG: VWA domain-containing protein, partial [bacterium]|nr:VWA domain-containing protein [bacterium]